MRVIFLFVVDQKISHYKLYNENFNIIVVLILFFHEAFFNLPGLNDFSFF